MSLETKLQERIKNSVDKTIASPLEKINEEKEKRLIEILGKNASLDDELLKNKQDKVFNEEGKKEEYQEYVEKALVEKDIKDKLSLDDYEVYNTSGYGIPILEGYSLIKGKILTKGEESIEKQYLYSMEKREFFPINKVLNNISDSFDGGITINGKTFVCYENDGKYFSFDYSKGKSIELKDKPISLNKEVEYTNNNNNLSSNISTFLKNYNEDILNTFEQAKKKGYYPVGLKVKIKEENKKSFLGTKETYNAQYNHFKMIDIKTGNYLDEGKEKSFEEWDNYLKSKQQ